jgi:hypothetical protein
MARVQAVAMILFMRGPLFLLESMR